MDWSWVVGRTCAAHVVARSLATSLGSVAPVSPPCQAVEVGAHVGSARERSSRSSWREPKAKSRPTSVRLDTRAATIPQSVGEAQTC